MVLVELSSMERSRLGKHNEIKSMEITLISSIVPQITVDIEKVKELSKKHA